MADTDTDSDGTADCNDVLPGDPDESTDTGGDGTGDNAATDDDSDGNDDSIADSLQQWRGMFHLRYRGTGLI